MLANRNIIKRQGFTIVELLIVIVVIAILAAITIVAYNGIQSRSKTSAAKQTANSVVKKAEAVNALSSSYPAALADFDAEKESKLSGSGIGLIATPVSGSGTNTVSYQKCTAGGTGVGGARVRYFDYATSAVSTDVMYLGVLTSANVANCTTWATPTLTAGS